MKNITEYINESLVNEGLFGTKQIDFAKQLCSAIRGYGVLWEKIVKKYVKPYGNGEGPLSLTGAFVEGEKILFSTAASSDLDLSNSQNMRIIIKIGQENQQIEYPFDGNADSNEKIDKSALSKNVSNAVKKLVKEEGAYEALFNALQKWCDEQGMQSFTGKVTEKFNAVNDALAKDPMKLLEFGDKSGKYNEKYVDKIFDKLCK